MKKRSSPRGEDSLQVLLNTSQKPGDEFRHYAYNEKDEQYRTVSGIEEKRESDVCDEGNDQKKEDTRDFPVLSESDIIDLDAILSRSIVKSGKTVSTELAELKEKIHQGDTKALKTLISALSYGSDAPPALGGGENLDRLGLKRDPVEALHVHKIAATLGDAASQQAIGVSFATEKEESSGNGLAVLYEYFSALNGDLEANLAMGDRYMNGRGVRQSCETALFYYAAASKMVVNFHKTVPNPTVVYKDRLDEVLSGRLGSHSDDRGEFKYILHTALNGDIASLVSVGNLLLMGTKTVPRDEHQAASFFKKAADLGDISAAGMLGWMNLKGVGMEQDLHEAYRLFQLGEEDREYACLTGLGYMHAKGLVVTHDLLRAKVYLQEACKSTFTSPEGNTAHAIKDKDSAQEEVGSKTGGTKTTSGVSKVVPFKSPGSHSMKKNRKLALEFFFDAHTRGFIDSSHYIGAIIAEGKYLPYNCAAAVRHFKLVAETGPSAELLRTAYDLYYAGSYDIALHLYLRLAEAGHELAQSNAAWMMMNGHCGQLGNEICTQLTVQMYTRAAGQKNAEAYIRLGNLYYSGWKSLEGDPSKSMEYYEKGAKMNSAQAMFNLGWMHQIGWGVSQDFEASKEHYVRCMHTSSKAKLPVLLSLGGMHLHIWYKELVRDILPMIKKGEVGRKFSRIGALLEEVVALDTLLLIVLCVLLLMVLYMKRRRHRR